MNKVYVQQKREDLNREDLNREDLNDELCRFQNRGNDPSWGRIFCALDSKCQGFFMTGLYNQTWTTLSNL
jgi:hypothetical protein